MNKMPCAQCGVSILVTTAMRNDGLCVPCRNGTRASMEENRRWYREHLERLRTDPAHLYWSALVHRVFKDADFAGLPEAEKRYFAVCCLSGEVHNGGFQQFFFNSAGAYYREALAGLEEMGAADCWQLLQRAKQVWFDFADVPVETRARRELLHKNSSRSRDSRSDELDRLFWKEAEALSAKIEDYAMTNKLY